jgi:hypothetical protein
MNKKFDAVEVSGQGRGAASSALRLPAGAE